MIWTPCGPVQTEVRPEVAQEAVALGVGSSALAIDLAKLHRMMVIAAIVTYRMRERILARVVASVFAVIGRNWSPLTTEPAAANVSRNRVNPAHSTEGGLVRMNTVNVTVSAGEPVSSALLR